MISFFNKATQRIAEAFNGPKVKDTEFDEKLEEMNQSEKGLNELRGILFNVDKNFAGLRFHFLCVYSAVEHIYAGNKQYEAVTSELISTHREMEEMCNKFITQFAEVKSTTTQWMGLFQEARLLIEKRKEARRVYEHYDDKMEKLLKERSQRSSETPDQLDYYNKVSVIFYMILIYFYFYSRMKLNSRIVLKDT